MVSRKDQNNLFKTITNRRMLFVQNSNESIERFLCAKCQDILIEPLQSECGCRFCSICLYDLSDERCTICPGCHENLGSISKNQNVDKAVEREISMLQFRCFNKPCLLTFKLKEYAKHLEDCEERREKCNLCDELYCHKEKEEHKEKNCKMIKTICEDCGIEMTKRDFMEVHRNVYGNMDLLCDKWIGACPYQCGEEQEVHANVKVHLIVCKMVVVDCEMTMIGCAVRLCRKEMDDHLKAQVPHHISLMMNELSRSKKDNDDISTSMRESNTKQNLEIDQLKKMAEESSTALRRLSEKYTSLLKGINVLNCGKYGEYKWQICNITDKINDAKKGINMQIFSESFYTDNPGYKILLKIYPNGDGKGLGTDLSFYFLIAKGDHDDDIVWPFSMRISLSLLTQRAGVSNRTINMKPDSNTNCYGKPSSMYNVAAGQPNFISHLDLKRPGDFMDDGTITVFAKIS